MYTHTCTNTWIFASWDISEPVLCSKSRVNSALLPRPVPQTATPPTAPAAAAASRHGTWRIFASVNTWWYQWYHRYPQNLRTCSIVLRQLRQLRMSFSGTPGEFVDLFCDSAWCPYLKGWKDGATAVSFWAQVLYPQPVFSIGKSPQICSNTRKHA